MENKSKDVIAINTRYPSEVHAFIQEEAKKNRRSFNSEVVWILQEHIKKQKRKQD